VSALVDAPARALGRPLALACSAAVLLGALALAAAFLTGTTAQVLPGVATGWLFFAGLSAGAVALAAATRIAGGRFLDPALPFLGAAGGALPWALLLLALSFPLARFWVPAHSTEALQRVAVRDLLAFALLTFLGRRVLGPSAPPRWAPAGLRDAIFYLLAFVLTVSMWTLDLLMNLYRGEPSAIVPAQAFMAAFVAAIAWASLWSTWHLPAGPSRLALGRMLFGFCAFWAYLVLCSFLPVWYANLPGEVGEILMRTSGGWRWFSFAIVGLTFALPFLALFSEEAKLRRSSATLAATSALLGLFAERALLLLRPLPQPQPGLPMLGGALAALGLAGAYLLFAGWQVGRLGERAASTGQ
jgi:predicted membrane channel-forming protein YqfA (hemolysin III family)